MIEVQQLVKRYGNVTAVNQVSFTAKKGEIVGLLGANGAGKTTTMRMLTGFMPPSAGTAKICGYDVLNDSIEVRRRVGYLPERVPVYPDMTVRGYITFWAKLRGYNQNTRINEVLDQFQLTDRQHQLIRHLSKGLRQRLGLAQALVHNPEVVILDEPTIGIDPRQVIEVREAVRALKEKHTVLFSSHILSEIEQVCDRVIIIDKGKVVAEGTPEALSQKIMGQQQIFIVVANAKPEAVIANLKRLPKIDTVRAMDDGYLITIQSKDDLRANISQTITQQGWTLLEMRVVDTRLEDVFLNLVK
jgi:ABC-2 type transport system ATP-binding protein